jgi:hypothetical protein
MLPVPFYTPTGQRVGRVPYHADEATAAQAAGADAGRVLTVVELVFTSPGWDDMELVAIGGDSDYCILYASLTAGTGPWTDITTTPLAVVAAEGVEVSVWLRPLVKRWSPGTENPDLDWSLWVKHRGAADLTS